MLTLEYSQLTQFKIVIYPKVVSKIQMYELSVLQPVKGCCSSKSIQSTKSRSRRSKSRFKLTQLGASGSRPGPIE